jgi:hypothetical protein
VAHCLVSSRLFSGAIARNKGKHSQLQASASEGHSLTQDHLLASCNHLSLGRLHHCESSRSFRFMKHSSFSCFLSFQFFLFLLVHTKSKKIV